MSSDIYLIQNIETLGCIFEETMNNETKNPSSFHHVFAAVSE